MENGCGRTRKLLVFVLDMRTCKLAHSTVLLNTGDPNSPPALQFAAAVTGWLPKCMGEGITAFVFTARSFSAFFPWEPVDILV